MMSPTVYNAGAYSWITVASLLRSSSDFVLIKKVCATELSLLPPSSYKIQEKSPYKVNNLKHNIHGQILQENLKLILTCQTSLC